MSGVHESVFIEAFDFLYKVLEPSEATSGFESWICLNTDNNCSFARKDFWKSEGGIRSLDSRPEVIHKLFEGTDSEGGDGRSGDEGVSGFGPKSEGLGPSAPEFFEQDEEILDEEPAKPTTDSDAEKAPVNGETEEGPRGKGAPPSEAASKEKNDPRW